MNARRWIFVVLLLGAAVGCVRLGMWQLARRRGRVAHNAAALASRGRAELSGGQALRLPPDSVAGRRVRARGSYDNSRTIVLRDRSWQGSPGVEVITPLCLAGDSAAVLVDRGWLPAPDGASADPDSFAESGTLEVVGLAELPDLPRSGGQPSTDSHGRVTWRRVDPPALQRGPKYPLAAFYLRQLPDPALPRYPRRLPPAELDEGPHLSYAIQWFFFGSLCLLGAGMVSRSPGRPR